MDRGGVLALEHDLRRRLTIEEVEEIEAHNAVHRNLGLPLSDRELAMSLLAEEVRMQRDHQLANRMALAHLDEEDEDIPELVSPQARSMAVNNGFRTWNPPVQQRAANARPVPPPPPPPPQPQPQPERRNTTTGTGTQNAPSASSSGSGSSVSWLFSWLVGTNTSGAPPRLTGHDCAVCQDPIRGFEFKAPCGDYYDKECLLELFTLATRDESLYPPRCCRQHIPVDEVLSLMSPDDARKFRDKATEFSTLKRVYCASPTCSRFLGPEYEGGWFSPTSYPCTSCATTTCAKCKNKYDLFHRCQASNDEQQVLSMGNNEGWARCPGCGQLIELHVGCYHMTCLCKTEFCYLCKARWKTCGCVQWDERRLLAAAEQRVDAQFGRPAPARRAPVPPRPAPAPLPARPAPAPAPIPARPAPAPLPARPALVPAPIPARPAPVPLLARLVVDPDPLPWGDHHIRTMSVLPVPVGRSVVEPDSLPWGRGPYAADIIRAPVQTHNHHTRTMTMAPVPVAQATVVSRSTPRTPALPPVNANDHPLRTSAASAGQVSNALNTRPVSTLAASYTAPVPRAPPASNPVPTSDSQANRRHSRHAFVSSPTSSSGFAQGSRSSTATSTTSSTSPDRASSYTRHTFVSHASSTTVNNSSASVSRRTTLASTSSAADAQAPARSTSSYTPIKFVSETATTTTTTYRSQGNSRSSANSSSTSNQANVNPTTISPSRRNGLSSTPFGASNATAGPSSSSSSRRSRHHTTDNTDTGRSSQDREAQNDALTLRLKRVKEAMEQLRVNHDCQHEKWKYRSGAERCQSCHQDMPLYIFSGGWLRVRSHHFEM